MQVVAVDKTGTLTKGKPELTDLVTTDAFTRTDVLRLVAAAEAQSEHPIARAIVDAAKTEGVALVQPEHFEAVPGFGLEARVDGHLVQVGADRYMTRLGLDTAVFTAQAERLGDEGKSPLFAAIDGQLAAVIAVADPIKDGSLEAVRALHAQGLKVAMITGDNTRTAHAIARQLGIDEVLAEVLPSGKSEAVKALQAGARRSPSSETASMTLKHSPRQTWAWPSARARTWRWKPPT